MVNLFFTLFIYLKKMDKKESHADKLIRWIKSQTTKTVRYNLLSFEAKKFLLFLAVPIGIYILFRDTERVAKMHRYVNIYYNNHII